MGVLLAVAIAPAFGQATPTPVPPGPPAVAPDPRVFIVGDSVSLGAQPAIAARLGSVGWQVNQWSVQSLHTWQASAVIDSFKAVGGIGDVVFVQLGTNDGSDPALFASEIDGVMQHLQDVPRVYWVNMRYFRDWVPAANAVIAAAATRWPNVRVVDWFGLSTPNPSFVYGDGYHLNPIGQAAMAELFATTLDAWVQERITTRTTVAVTTAPPPKSSRPAAVALARGPGHHDSSVALTTVLAGVAGALVLAGSTALVAARVDVRRRRQPSA